MPEVATRRYAIVSPLWNEARHVRRTLDSVTGQTEPPVAWVAVDHGSTDETASIVTEYANRFPYISLVSLSADEFAGSVDRLKQGAAPRAFNAGLSRLDLGSIDYVVKLDGDLEFGADYFSGLMDEFERDPLLGIAGGRCYVMHNGRREWEWVP
jgi:glycosyltransferase involved in cell wall biosynthesis